MTTEEKPTKFDVAGFLDGGGSECGDPLEAGKGEKSFQTRAQPRRHLHVSPDETGQISNLQNCQITNV